MAAYSFSRNEEMAPSGIVTAGLVCTTILLLICLYFISKIRR
jgi:hypothetical protein